MLVEDDALLSELLVKKLTRMGGGTIAHFRDGAEALAHMKQDPPSIVLLDILMPGMDGFEVLQQIKTDPALAHIPVLLLSNLGQEADIKRGKKLGAVNFLVKATVTLDEIVSEIKRILVP